MSHGDLVVELPHRASRFYHHGWTSWSPTTWVKIDEARVDFRGAPESLQSWGGAPFDRMSHVGYGVGAVEHHDDVVLLGAVTGDAPRVGSDGSTLVGRTECGRGDWFVARGSETEVFSAYASVLGDRFSRKSTTVDRVWSSWYSYYERIEEELLAQTVGDLTGLPFDVVQVDDGWERGIGDWQPNDRFPSGMSATARRIADAGFRPGLWLAPLIASESSEIARLRPEIFVKAPDGQPAVAGRNWGGDYLALDGTHPGAVDHLRETICRAVDWGFTFLKLDFLFAGAIVGERLSDRGREDVFRELLQRIRSWVGDDVYLLGSGNPILPALGILDGMRVGPDTAAYWRNVAIPDLVTASSRNALATSAHRGWLMDLCQPDPDVVYFRRRRSLLSEDQRIAAQHLATAFGFRATSDPADWLTPDERHELDQWLQEPSRGKWCGDMRYRLPDGRVVDLRRVLDAPEPVWSIAE